jgi:hypothetical protein
MKNSQNILEEAEIFHLPMVEDIPGGLNTIKPRTI